MRKEREWVERERFFVYYVSFVGKLCLTGEKEGQGEREESESGKEER